MSEPTNARGEAPTRLDVDFEEIDRLLHDAERAQAGADFAQMMRDNANAKELRAKAQRLLEMANAFDPTHLAPAWEEV